MASSLVRTLRSRRDTKRLGTALAQVLSPGDLVVLAGDLGTGKTFLAACIARALGVTEPVTSPTFALVHEYTTPHAVILHGDLYRLRDGPHELALEVAQLGLRERRSEGALVLVEWAEEALDAMGGDPAVVVRLAITGARQRVATLSGRRAGDIVY